jgi:DNA-binding PadR family transcriptional regulator
MAVPSGKRLRILQLLLEHKELTGGQLLELDRTLPRGTIYTTLRRLEDDAFASSREESQRGQPGPPRRFYRITTDGARATKAGELAEKVMAGATVRLVPRRQFS